MLNVSNPSVRQLLLKSNVGLEREGMRVTAGGRFAHTPHPFGTDPHIVRDFSENQTEINTSPCPSAHEVIASLRGYTVSVQRILAAQGSNGQGGAGHSEGPELFWPFSNPPFIADEEDIPIAVYPASLAHKAAYRRHLSARYGRYKMTFSGIHVNFSFADDLLAESFRTSGGSPEDDPAGMRAYKDALYLDLAQGCVAYGWIINALTAASPILDLSYLEKGVFGGAAFLGMASIRCSELGYWNQFTPVLDYTKGVAGYADSIERYVHDGLIVQPSELYYPIRLKPRGENTLDNLRKGGVNHIELRIFDLNPFCVEALDERDVAFAQLLLVWLASTPRRALTATEQVQAVQNFKSAAHYDLDLAQVTLPSESSADGTLASVAEAGLSVLDEMGRFYQGLAEKADGQDGTQGGTRAGGQDDGRSPQTGQTPSAANLFGSDVDIAGTLAFEREKLVNPQARYAYRVRQEFGNDFVRRGIALARAQQEELLG